MEKLTIEGVLAKRTKEDLRNLIVHVREDLLYGKEGTFQTKTSVESAERALFFIRNLIALH